MTEEDSLISKKTYESIVGKKIRYDILYKYETAVRLIKKHKKGRLKILDIGCGQGILSFYISKNWQLYGIDADEDRIRRAGKIKFKNAKFSVADAENLSFNFKFDVILALDIIEHLKHPEKCLKKISKLLKKGGILIVSNPNKHSMWELFLNKWLHLEDHRHYWSPDEFDSMTKVFGLELREVLPRPVFSESIGWLMRDYRRILDFDDRLGRRFPKLATGWFLVFKKS